MLKFPHITRPAVICKFLKGMSVKPHRLPVIFFAIDFQKMRSQNGDIINPVAQGRHINNNSIYSVKEIFPEFSLCYHTGKIAVGCTDQADVNRNGLIGTNPHHLSALKGVKEFGLGMKRQVADLVKEESASRSKLEFSLAIVPGISESAPHMSEQLTLKQCFRHRSHINAYKKLPCPARPVVDLGCKQFLAGTVLAGYKDIGIGGGNLLNDVQNINHCGRRPVNKFLQLLNHKI